ncbi:hypothetical protein BKC11_05085 [Salmonella enterica subsp. enterica serovar Typhimurium]|nr:hypothetical protein BKC11_05085 [Salmonella enterica subsp. enterica serovar Typhimurium]
MPVLISGVLKDGTGTPVQNCTIQLKACRTSTTVVVNTVASENPDDAGRYSMDVEQGQYTVTLLVEGYPPSHAGVITVYDDSKPGTLNDFLGAMTEDDVRPEALRRFEAMVEEVARQASEASRNATAAGQASEQAQTSAGQAAESATAAVNAAGAAEASATQAASSAASAESSAGTATTKAGEASASAASADTARTAAAASAAAAKTSEANADASRTAAGDSAAAAAASATAAQTSAERAGASETAAKTSETQAASSAGDAGASATAAAASEKAAAASAAAAKISETNAATSASTAAASATAASSSASEASTHAAASDTSASLAAQSSTAAGAAATRAEDAAKRAEDIADVISLEDASLTKKGIVKLSSATDSDSEALAATPKAVHAVMDEVQTKAPLDSPEVKDARVSLMYFNARHVEKTIVKERSPVLDMGNLVHVLALQPENLEAEFSVEPEIPEGAFTTTATLREFIDAHNASLPALLSADDIKALLEEYNATLPSQMPLGASVDETYASYEQLPEEFQRIENGTKHTATAMKACIKEYNATLPAPVKTSGSRDALLEQLAIINPDLVAQEAQKSSPLKVSGTKADLIQAVKSVNPAVVFADELLDAWRENTEGKVLVTRQQLSTALNIQKALLEHPTAGKLLTHPSRAVEVSYFGIDEETGLEVRVRPDLELDMGGLRIGADLKTISMWNIKQEGLRAKLHREIIDRDYHLSAAMYCETAALDQFFWIFVNKDENYHWVAIIEASTELLELGMLEYRKTMREIANGFDTGEWSAPITEDYTDELNDFDVRRLEALRVQA